MSEDREIGEKYFPDLPSPGQTPAPRQSTLSVAPTPSPSTPPPTSDDDIGAKYFPDLPTAAEPGPSASAESLAPIVSGTAGWLGQVVDYPSHLIERFGIQPVREAYDDFVTEVRALANWNWTEGGSLEDYAKARQRILDNPWIDTAWGKRGLEWAAEQAGLPTTRTAPAEGPYGRAGQHALETAIEYAGPGLTAKIARSPGEIANAVRTAGQILSPGPATGSALIGATTGTAQQVVAEKAADPETPQATRELLTDPRTQQAIGVLTPMVTGAVPTGVRSAKGRLGIPGTEEQRQEIAQRRAQGAIQSAVTDPMQAAADLRLQTLEDQRRQEILQGSPGATTAELMNNPLLLSIQRLRERQSPEMKEEMMRRDAASNDAQWRAIQSLADRGTSAGVTQNVLTFYRETLDQLFAQEAEAARAEAERTRQAAQPTMSPEQQGAAAKGAVEAEREPLTQRLQQELQDAGLNAELARDMLGGIEPLAPEARFQVQERAGQAFRDPIVAVNEAERERLQELRRAIDPTNTMVLNKFAINNALTGIRRDFEPRFFSPKENQLYGWADEWGDQVKLDDALKLRQEINSQLRSKDILPNERLRLTKLKQGIDQATDDAVNNEYQTQVTAGGGNPDTRLSKDIIQKLDDLGPQTIETYGRYLRSDPAILRKAMQEPTTAEILRRTDPNTAAAGDQTAQPMDEATRQKWADWNQQFREYKQKMESETGRPGQLHAVGKTIEPGGAYDAYKLPDHRVPALFIEGPDAPLAIDRFISAVGPEVAQPILENAFRLSLRSQDRIMNPNGTMNLTVFYKWFAAHQDGLSRLPAVMGKFQNAGEAHMRLQEADEAFAQHQRDYPLDRGLNDSAILGQYFKPGPQGGELMRQYLEMTGNRPEALTAAADYAAYDFANYAIDKNTGMVNLKKANTWISQRALALGQIPGLKDLFLDATTAQRTFEETLARHNRMRSEWDKSVAGTVLGADIDKVAERLFTRPDRGQRATELMNIIGNIRKWRPGEAEGALDGLKRAMIDHIYQKYSGAAQPGSEYNALAAKRYSDFLNDNKEVLNTVFGPQAWKVFETVSEDAGLASLVQNAKRTGGSDTAELLHGMGKNRNASWLPWFQAYAFERLAEGGAHLAGHAAGAVAGATIGHYVAPLLAWLTFQRMKTNKEALNVASDQAFDHLLMHPEDAADALEAYKNPRLRIPNSTMQRYFGRIVQGMILNSEGHETPVRKPAYRVGGRVRVQGGGDIEPAPEIFWRGSAIIPQATPHRFH